MYCDRNFRSKKELEEAVDRYNANVGKQEHGLRPVTYHLPGYEGTEPQDGCITVSGPHFSEPHCWYARCDVVNGVIIKVR